MRGPLRRSIAALLIAAVLLAGAGFGAAIANEAGLVIEHGDGSVTYVLVTFPEDEIASIELLRKSGLSLTTVSSGGFGEAVCSIESEGCGVTDCRTRLCQTGDANSPFWKFFRAGDESAWVMQPLGASAAKVRGGEIDLWSWTGGDPALAVVDLAGIVELTGAPAERPEDAVYVARFDATGSPIAARESEDPADGQTLAGGLMLLVLGGVALFLLVRRRRPAQRP
ncbi:MAG: hypothetical protein IT334_01995 [Thermomicrobiales bacterium]|nr:hypothetical protein [Thermomicrobiales bacterium]